MKLMRAKVDELKLDPRNARSHPERNLEEIKRSLLRFGQQKPVVIGSDYVVIAGNGTVLAARDLGWPRLDAVMSELTGEDAKAYGVADNRTAELADWHTENLADILKSLTNLEGTGFNESELDELIAGLLPEPQGKTDPDDVPAEPKEPQTKVGDVWRLGEHRLMCGDSTNSKHFVKLLNHESFDMVWTDPPYGVDYVGGTKDALKITNDKTIDGAIHLWRAAVENVIGEQRPGGSWYVTVPGTSGWRFAEVLEEHDVLRQSLVWVKDRFVLGRSDYHYQHEAVLYGWKPGAAHTFRGGFTLSSVIDNDVDITKLSKENLLLMVEQIRQQSSVLREDRPSKSPDHPTTKPVALIQRCIDASSLPGQIVLDPFGGSGSTLIACWRSQRTARLMEVDPKYCDVICRRFEEHTGIVPVLENTGQEFSFIEEEN